MFFQSHEDKTTINEKKIKELTIKADALNKEIENFYSEIAICPKKLADFSRKEENFFPEAWKELEKQRAMLDEKLSMQIKDIRNPLEAKGRYEDRNIARHWIPVR